MIVHNWTGKIIQRISYMSVCTYARDVQITVPYVTTANNFEMELTHILFVLNCALKIMARTVLFKEIRFKIINIMYKLTYLRNWYKHLIRTLVMIFQIHLSLGWNVFSNNSIRRVFYKFWCIVNVCLPNIVCEINLLYVPYV